MSRIVFMGTPFAAVPTLELLAESHDVVLVVTQPDRPRGRSKRLVAPPIKEAAEARSLPVAQPTSREDLRLALEDRAPYDVGVVVAYGRILPPEVLAIPRHGFLNVHFSLLPRWRGAAPVERALIVGDEMTGVTIIRLDEGLDTGPVLTAQAIDIPPEDDSGRLTTRLARVGARLLDSVLGDYVLDLVEPVEQSSEGVTYADKITADDRPLDGIGSVVDFVNRVRGLAPSPAATLDIDGKHHKVLVAAAHEASPEPGTWEAHHGVPVVGLEGGGVALVELQPPGKRPQTGEEWVRGRRRAKGTVGGHTLR